MIGQAIADLCLWLQAANSIERLDMGLNQVAQNAQGAYLIMFARREETHHIPLECIHVWFVDRHPKVAEVSQALYNIGDVAYEVMNVGLVRKAATSGKPKGASNGNNRHERLNVAGVIIGNN